MLAKDVYKQLLTVQEEYKDSPEGSQEQGIFKMAKDSADAMKSLLDFVDFIGKMSTCNTCVNPGCTIRPKWGDAVRYNCAFHLGVVYNNSGN